MQKDGERGNVSVYRDKHGDQTRSSDSSPTDSLSTNENASASTTPKWIVAHTNALVHLTQPPTMMPSHWIMTMPWSTRARIQGRFVLYRSKGYLSPTQTPGRVCRLGRRLTIQCSLWTQMAGGTTKQWNRMSWTRSGRWPH